MPELYLPPSVLRDRRLENEAQAFAAGVFVRDDRCREFDPLLLNVEPWLRMLFCREPAPLEVVAAGARPGRYNIVREPPHGEPVTFIPIVGPAGEYVEPTSRVFDTLKAMDWWNDEVKRDRVERENRIEDARRKAQAEERRRIDDEVFERFQAVSRTQVSMNPDTAWGQNARGAGLARAEKKRREKT